MSNVVSPGEPFTSAEIAFLQNLAAQGSVGSSILISTGGIIDDNNLVFNFPSLPSALVINGAVYKQTNGSITWTWNAGNLTASLSSPVGTNGSIFGLK